ncbi:MAG TPA: response regulator [Thermoanaerobaculia bacterium]|jgi:CheY-like chemotaxis protein
MPSEEKRILVVDDDAAIRTLLFTILRRRGLAVDVARNGEEALERLRECIYVLMLLDLMMPVMSGWEVLDRLAGIDTARQPVVVVLTAGTEPRGVSPEFVAGSIRKPFDMQLLLDTVTGCIAAVGARRQLADCPPSETAN